MKHLLIPANTLPTMPVEPPLKRFKSSSRSDDTAVSLLSLAILANYSKNTSSSILMRPTMINQAVTSRNPAVTLNVDDNELRTTLQALASIGPEVQENAPKSLLLDIAPKPSPKEVYRAFRIPPRFLQPQNKWKDICRPLPLPPRLPKVQKGAKVSL